MLTGFDKAVGLIEVAFNTGWAASVYSAKKIRWPGDHAFVEPDGDLWVRVAISGGQAATVGIAGQGNNMHRAPGLAIFSVFAPYTTSPRATYAVGEVIAGFFRGTSESSLRYTPPPYLSGVIEVDGWNQVNVNVPFLWDMIA